MDEFDKMLIPEEKRVVDIFIFSHYNNDTLKAPDIGVRGSPGSHSSLEPKY